MTGNKTSRNSYLQRKYGITEEDYEELLKNQDGGCAICACKPRKQRLDVDHDHKTGEVRGLLCRWCNHRLLGGAREKADILRRAIEYLESPPARKVLNAKSDTGRSQISKAG